MQIIPVKVAGVKVEAGVPEIIRILFLLLYHKPRNHRLPFQTMMILKQKRMKPVKRLGRIMKQRVNLRVQQKVNVRVKQRVQQRLK
jgi:hypothetical protein